MNWFHRHTLRCHIGILVAVLALAAACAPSGASTTTGSTPAAAASTPGPAAPSAATVSMTDALKFEPATVTVARGGTVTWTNSTATMHTVTDDPSKAANKADAALPSGAQPWDSGTLNPGQTFSHTFDTPGTYKYFCTPHEAAGMVGTITVTG
jgi:plastocyanin